MTPEEAMIMAVTTREVTMTLEVTMQEAATTQEGDTMLAVAVTTQEGDTMLAVVTTQDKIPLEDTIQEAEVDILAEAVADILAEVEEDTRRHDPPLPLPSPFRRKRCLCEAWVDPLLVCIFAIQLAVILIRIHTHFIFFLPAKVSERVKVEPMAVEAAGWAVAGWVVEVWAVAGVGVWAVAV